MRKMIRALRARLSPWNAFGVALVCINVASAQSLKETADWLRDFVQSEGRVSNLDWRDQYRVSINDCHATILQETRDLSCTRPENKAACGRDFPHVTTNQFQQEFNLKEIDVGRIAVENEPSFRAYAVTLTTLNERPLVIHSVKLGAAFSKSGQDRGAYVVFRTREGAERAAKAFRHVAGLCGAKESPF